jgi:serine/threonine protein kinase
MTPLSDPTLDHLRRVASEPDLDGTRYELGEAIGRGGMGVVFAARDRELDRTVALKVLSAAGPGTAARMTREARILARLEHPGMVPVHDVGTLPDGRIYYAMKYVRGERLDTCRQRLGGVTERLRLFLRICEPVAFAHSHGVVHRDLKPQNVMIGAFGEVLVLDWGIAKVLVEPDFPGARPPTGNAHPDDTSPGTVLGTPGYMAPEQASGAVGAITGRTDVFALGAILRFLFAPTQPGTPRAVRAICAKALAPEPEDRYGSVAELMADVSHFLDGLAVSAYPEGVFRRARRLAGRYRTAILLVVAYLVMRILLIAWRQA